VNAPRSRLGYPRGGTRRAGLMLAGTVLFLAGLTGAAPAHGAGDVIARLGPLTISATALRPGPGGTLTTYILVGTSGRPSDQLDAAIVADGAAVAVYHRQVNVGEISDLTGCGTELPPPGIVDHWLHYGPLLVPGRSGGPAPPADATLTVPPDASRPAGATLAITLYFAHAGSVILRLRVGHAWSRRLS
jgi:hypothetical protein